jgi:hypothetical protein
MHVCTLSLSVSRDETGFSFVGWRVLCCLLQPTKLSPVSSRGLYEQAVTQKHGIKEDCFAISCYTYFILTGRIQHGNRNVTVTP